MSEKKGKMAFCCHLLPLFVFRRKTKKKTRKGVRGRPGGYQNEGGRGSQGPAQGRQGVKASPRSARDRRGPAQVSEREKGERRD